MEISPFLSPTLLFAIVMAIGGLIVKAVRLQSKVDTADTEIKQLYSKVAEQKGVLDTHRENTEIHFNLRLHQEIERRQDDRFRRVEGRLEHIEEKMDQLLAK